MPEVVLFLILVAGAILLGLRARRRVRQKQEWWERQEAIRRQALRSLAESARHDRSTPEEKRYATYVPPRRGERRTQLRPEDPRPEWGTSTLTGYPVHEKLWSPPAQPSADDEKLFSGGASGGAGGGASWSEPSSSSDSSSSDVSSGSDGSSGSSD